jgi:hypothetical protein
MKCTKTTTNTGRNVEDMLREIAYVLNVTRQIKSEMRVERAEPKSTSESPIAEPIVLSL